MARPTKFDDANLERLYQAIRMGLAYVHACQYAGISYDTFNEWRKGKFPKSVKAEQKAKFSEDLTRAEGDAVMRLGTLINSAAKNDWKAAAWLMERRYPDEYGKSVQEHRTAEGKPMQVQMESTVKRDASVLDQLDAEGLRLLDQLVARTRNDDDEDDV